MSHKVWCATLDPTPGMCDCGAPSHYEIGFAAGKRAASPAQTSTVAPHTGASGVMGPVVTPEPVAELCARVETMIGAYVDDYEYAGDEESYQPKSSERDLIMDAIHGLLADDEFVRTFNAWQLAARSAPAVPAGVATAAEFALRCDGCSGDVWVSDPGLSGPYCAKCGRSTTRDRE